MIDRREQTLAADAEARSLAHTEFERPVVIEAGAGTGKTALLVARVVAWSVGPGWDCHADRGARDAVARRVVERVVAITFTDAAAAEMAERVARALSDLAVGTVPVGVDRALLQVEDDEELAARCAALADEVHRLQAQTIHSWCHHLLRTFSLEAGIHPRFEVDSDGVRVEETVEEAVAEALRSLAGRPEAADWEVLAAAGVMPVDVADAAQRLVLAGVPAARLLEDPCDDEVMTTVMGQLSEALNRLDVAGLQALTSATAATARAATALDRLRCDLAAASPGRPESVAAALGQIDAATRERLGKWARDDLTQTEARLVASRDALVQASATLAPLLAGLQGFAPALLGAARNVLAAILDSVAGRLTCAGVATFDDLLRLTAQLLESSDPVCAEVRRNIDQLMVDEFQDTDETQCRMVRALALVQRGPRPGLFIVGDPKQSIYGWRRADLAAYDGFIGEVEEAGGVIRPLVRNFRSTQLILDEVERMVGPVMVRETGVQPEFQRLEATDKRRDEPGFAEGHWAPVEHWVTRSADPEGAGLADPVRVDDAIADEAAALASDVRRLVTEGRAKPGDVAILVRATTALEPVLDSLRAAEVPFEVARERQYYQQREVVEAAALVRLMIEPADQLALLTVLRSDAVGVPDAALAPLWDAGLPSVMARIFDWDGPESPALEACIQRAAAAVPDDVPGVDEIPRWPDLLRNAAATVGFLRRAIREQPPDVFVERLRTLWLTEATATARFLGRFRRARLERFFTELESSLATDDGSLAPVARLLRRAVEEGREPQVPGDPDVAADAVHVMTIHGAKGLDFDHVYVCQLQKRDPGGFGGASVELRQLGGQFEYRLFGWPTPGFGAAERNRLERERAERVRLLYVASTRAKRRLVVSGRWRLDGELVPANDARSFEDLIAHRASPDELHQQARDGEWRRFEVGRGVQWVLPAFAPESDGAPRGEKAAERAYDLHRVRAESRRLADLRDQASQRAALPVSVAASALRGSPGPTVGVEQQLVGEAAAAAGTSVHRFLELLDLRGDLGEQVVARRAEVLQWAAAGAGTAAELARRRAGEVLDRLLGGRTLAVLTELADQVVARELPLLVPVGPDGPAVSAILGVADLVYRRGDRLVVADFKTDLVQSDEEIAGALVRYRPQLELYARALHEALELSEPPLMELWFLQADRIVALAER